MPTKMPTASMPERFYPDATVTHELETPELIDGQRPLVRLSRISGQVVAATPSGLIAQITSPSLLDYDLLSDVFLTYRAFVSASNMLTALMARLAWVVNRADDFGRIVRVRVFVGLRHWILNYFKDDFVPDATLRRQFCDMINDLAFQLRSREDGGGGDLKIVGELKKCWRRTCNLYYDVPEHDLDGAVVEVHPGSRMLVQQVPQSQDATATSERYQGDSNAMPAHQHRSGQRPSEPRIRNGMPTTDEREIIEATRPTLKHSHRNSDQSVLAVSCSIPIRSSKKSRPNTPAANTTMPTKTLQRVPSASLPPSVARSRSRSRTFRTDKQEQEAPPEVPQLNNSKTKSKDSRADDHLAAVALLSGSIIRGHWVAPKSAHVDSFAPLSPPQSRPPSSSGSWSGTDSSKADEKWSTNSNPGIRHLIGSMRRVLSTKHDSAQPTDAAFEMQRKYPYDAEATLSRKSTHSHLRALRNRPTMAGLATNMPRIDLLAAKNADDYECAQQSARGRRASRSLSLAERSAQAPWSDSPDGQSPKLLSPGFGRMHSEVTEGSRSIVIFDATGNDDAIPPLPSNLGWQTLPTNVNRSSKPLWNQSLIAQMNPEAGQEGQVNLADQQMLTPPASRSNSVTSEMSHKNSKANSLGPDQTLAISLHAAPDQRGLTSTQDGVLPNEQDVPVTDTVPQLKRQPGGNLRKVEHVHSLHGRHETLSSDLTDVGTDLNSHISRPLPEPTTSGAAQTLAPPKGFSLMSAHSSQPNLRPSFEREVAKLAQIPDRQEDDGGIEATLRKLEGSGRDQVDSLNATDATSGLDLFQTPYGQEETSGRPEQGSAEEEAMKSAHREHEIIADLAAEPDDTIDTYGVPHTDRPLTFFEEDSRIDLRQPTVAGSERSGRSTPLLERGVSKAGVRRRRSSSDWLKVSLPPPKPERRRVIPSEELPTVGVTQPTAETLETPVAADIYDLPPTTSTHRSFFIDDNQSLVDAGQDRSFSSSRGHRPTDSSHFDDNFSVLSDSGNNIASHPFRHSSTPPYKTQPRRFEQLPPSVRDCRPAHELKSKPRATPVEPALQDHAQVHYTTAPQHFVPPLSEPKHLPFILGQSSMTLAKQMTLIERDALSEIDWRELIDLRWSQSSQATPTWARYLSTCKEHTSRNKTIGGVDLCISRFNLMVKWAASEIVLCENPLERVACVVKYIHLAQACRRMHNWATMYQITTALLQGDVSRLKQTWAQVPAAEMEVLKHLETLIMPMRNFANLRAEMENGTSNADAGCIPFIGLFTHDLIYNASKPAYAQQAAASVTVGHEAPQQEKLINFDRYRTAASIVKSLLRMLDASSRYDFEPQPEVLSHCLWMACLDDAEISRKSRTLEP